ncbi:MAG: exodeoxyribonuclease VII large subunit [Pseudomonadales bacterium]
MTAHSSTSREVLAVSELNRQAKRLLEGHFQQVWVQGEISNFARPQSGHWYFSLKDSKAQIRCAMFRNRNSLLRFKPTEGDELIARGRISLYEGRGDFQLIVDNIQPAGAGALQVQLEQLKEKLRLEGLFNNDNKRILPQHPRHVAIVSSASGAALQDILTVFKRRAPQVVLSVLPVSVQGAGSAEQLTKAITALSSKSNNFKTPIDAIVVARGGGSLEDLWSFNSEALARAIHQCDVPVVSAVGHETDFTICDLVADVRAPTPTAAAELLSPDSSALVRALADAAMRLQRMMLLHLDNAAKDLIQTSRLLRHPGRRLEEHSQRCDDLQQRMLRAIASRLKTSKDALAYNSAGLLANSPQHAIELARARIHSSQGRLAPAIKTSINHSNANLAHYARMLHTVSPLATLQRGYGIVELAQDDDGYSILRDAEQASPGQQLRARLAHGHVMAEVTAIETGNSDNQE